ncbi:MAG: hypothetical protein LBV23_00620 [Deltaproteobacteria bacterium]|nr:hypothetical protein [Deltaproteobacteria bacterium]
MSREQKKTGGFPLGVDKVIFLDIDGVIRPHGVDKFYEKFNENDYLSLFDQLYKKFNIDYSIYNPVTVANVYFSWSVKAISLVKKVIDQTGAKIVLSSDWKLYSYEMMKDLFTIHGLDKFYIDNTEDIPFEKYKEIINDKNYSITELIRTTEILYYVKLHPEIKRFVAIDDLELRLDLNENFINTRIHDYFTENDAKLCIKFLNNS